MYIFVKHLCINTCDQIKDDRCGTELARTSRYHLYLSAVSVSTFVHIYMCEHFMVFGALCRSGTPRLRACLTSSSGRVTHTKVTGSKDSLGKINFCECFSCVVNDCSFWDLCAFSFHISGKRRNIDVWQILCTIEILHGIGNFVCIVYQPFSSKKIIFFLSCFWEISSLNTLAKK